MSNLEDKKEHSLVSEAPIPFNKPYIAGKELYNIAQAVLVNGHLSGNGPFSRQCEEWLQNALGCRKALLTHSCTAALEMSAMLCDLQPGDEVIMPSFTFVSTANAFSLRGARPVFVDIRRDNLNIDESLIREAITPRTRAIVPVHYAGTACDMDQIRLIAQEYDLFVIEDAAHALLSTLGGKYLGTIGDLGCLSFHETKNVISGEGGALLVNSDRMIEKAEIIREKGTNRNQFVKGEVDRYTWVELGSSFLPSDIIAAFLLAQLELSPVIIEARCRILDAYNKLLRPLEEDGLVRLPKEDQNSVCNGHLFYLITGSQDERTRLITFLAGEGISAVFHYVPLHSSPAGKRYGRASGDLRVTEDLSGRLLRLPLYFGMTEQEVFRVASVVKRFYMHKP